MPSDNAARQLKELIKNVQGWLTDREGKFLYKIAQGCQGQGVIVEIGCGRGRSTICLGRGSQEGHQVKVYAIDSHSGNPEHQYLNENGSSYNEFKKNIENARLEHLVTPIVKTSQEAERDWGLPIEILFIDGAHEYESVKNDFLLWSSHLIEGGIIAIHDTTACLGTLLLQGRPGPKKVAEKYILQSDSFRDVGLVDTITYARKCRRNTPEDLAQIQRVRLQKIIPDLKHLIFWNLANLLLPQKAQQVLKKRLKGKIKFV